MTTTTKSTLTALTELKTEEGYSADIYPWRYMSVQCRHNDRTTSHERYMSHEGYILRETVCGHSADIILQGYMYALYISSVFTSEVKMGRICKSF